MPSRFSKIDEENGAAPSSIYRSSRIDNTLQSKKAANPQKRTLNDAIG
ncbi:hypothetical protein SHD_2209 [Shewanella decolorationis S12]|uniref:Uncharacterized protein n=1 Tax=Shewanella decolorationis S12 TaxID=1353536 RepID=A0ABP2Z731_9GAMM|nr:hypothetical protein SHD_2209 [Shewanella decolorationis S12]